jgi:hypothetical protein
VVGRSCRSRRAERAALTAAASGSSSARLRVAQWSRADALYVVDDALLVTNRNRINTLGAHCFTLSFSHFDPSRHALPPKSEMSRPSGMWVGLRMTQVFPIALSSLLRSRVQVKIDDRSHADQTNRKQAQLRKNKR